MAATARECVVCLEEYEASGKHKPKMLADCGHSLCLGCLEKIVAMARHGEIICQRCNQTYAVTDAPADEQFKDNYPLKECIGDLNPVEGYLNSRLVEIQKLKEEKQARLEKLKDQMHKRGGELERSEILLEQAVKEKDLAEKELSKAKPEWEAARESWARAKEATEKAEARGNEANKSWEDRETAGKRSAEENKLALESCEFVKQHYEVVTAEYEKATGAAIRMGENFKKMTDKFTNAKVIAETVKKEMGAVKHELALIEIGIREVELAKAKLTLKRRRTEMQ